MFNYLKRRLGIDDLEEQSQFYHKQWLQIEHHFDEMNDHLIEIKEMIKTHEEQMDQRIFKHHTEVMARLGMVLTALEKAAPQYAVSPMVQTIPLTVRGARGRPKKMKEDKKDA